jgi:hypothetical protein
MKTRQSLLTHSKEFAASAEHLLRGELELRDDALVPQSRSRIRDNSWCFYDPKNPEHLGHATSEFTLTWEKDPELKLQNGELDFTRAPLPEQLLHDLQNFAFVLLEYYPLFARHKKGSKHEIKIRSFVSSMNNGLFFTKWMIQTSRLRPYFIRNLSDISIAEIELAAADYPYALNNRVMTFFTRIAHPFISKCLSAPPPFTQADVENINWELLYRNNKKHRATIARHGGSDVDIRGRSTFLPLHPELFEWLSNTTRADVADCLDAIGIPREDTSENPILAERHARRLRLTDEHPDITQWWTRLAAAGPLPVARKPYRKAIDAIEDSLGLRRGASTPLLGALARGQKAAQSLVLQYTAMRSGSARTLKSPLERGVRKSTLRLVNGYWMVVGLNTKGRASRTPADADKWLAIDCVRDSIRLLEHFMSVHGNPYIFAAWKRKKRNTPRNDTSLANAIQSYIAERDIEGRFVKTVHSSGPRPKYVWIRGGAPSPIRFRHSLVAELARADCGLPMITMQLKHVHSLFMGFSTMTMGYGGMREHSLNKVKGAIPAWPTDLQALMDEKTRRTQTARQEIFEAYFNPDRRFAGGGGDAHQARLNELFVGKGYSESQRSKYIKQLANNGAPLVACGLGYCNKRYAETDEVCKGDLCDPDCHNHVVTEVKIPIIKLRLRNCNEMLARPEQSHQIPKWKRDQQVLEELLVKLGATEPNQE